MNIAPICKHLHANPNSLIGQQWAANFDDNIGTGFTPPFLHLVIVTHAFEELVTELAGQIGAAEFLSDRIGQFFAEFGMDSIDACFAGSVPSLSCLGEITHKIK